MKHWKMFVGWVAVLATATGLTVASGPVASAQPPGKGRMDGAVARAAGLGSAPVAGKAIATPLVTDSAGRVVVYVEG